MTVTGSNRGASLARFILASLLFASAVQAREQKITAADGGALDQFGFSVGISGDTLVVGAFLDAADGNFEQGSAYVFTRNGGVWAERAKLSARDGGARDEFGFGVAISGETIAVGSRKSDVGGNEDQGLVSIFERAGSGWTESARLTASSAEAGDLFGHAVAIHGDTLLVGAPLVDVGPYASYGAAYVFVRAGNSWSQQAILQATDGFTADFFGGTVAIDADTAVVGVSFHDAGGNPNQGAVYVFVRHGSSWVQQAKLTAPDGASNDRFGFAVALGGDTAVVGSYGNDVGTNANQGSVYVFVRQQGTWTQRSKLAAADGGTFDNLGYSVAISGETIVAGAAGDDESSGLDQGSAYLFPVNAPRGRRRAVGK